MTNFSKILSQAVPRGYVDELELQQRYLIAGLRKLYCFLEEKDAWPGSMPSLRSDDGQPFVHDILASLDLLSETSYCGPTTNRLLCPQCGYDIHLQTKAAGSEKDSPTIPTSSASIQSEDVEAQAEYMHTSPAAQLPTGMTWAPEDDRTSASIEPGPAFLPATGIISSQQSFVGPPTHHTGPFVYQPSIQEVLTLPSGDLVPNDLPPPGIDTSFHDLGVDSPWLSLGTYPLHCLNTNIVEMI